MFRQAPFSFTACEAKAFLVLALFVPSAGVAHAQQLPSPSRTIYKCEVAQKVVYSDSPCLGAQRIDIEPTRGLNQSSGRKLVGADVQREHNRELIAEVVRPLTGMDAKQLDIQGRRMKLAPEIRTECARLDAAIPALELAEKRATKQELPDVQARLLDMRKRFRARAC